MITKNINILDESDKNINFFMVKKKDIIQFRFSLKSLRRHFYLIFKKD